ncbi:hypothetical protein EKN06_00490 [Croceicoccus ponticola]|uniref:Uncharacterized protein n=1 Tax=Croceicoccus ponticola TaxID=2217664 RepID=A0A437GZF9_9SPHN|nr:hypothetical protein [Croceicoccus ponticola]RVQ68747.1 hypothetical protein EKN06_00490 [Croceicoccus ponticola]
MQKLAIAVLSIPLASCAANQAGLLKNDVIDTYFSEKSAGVVAGCLQQSLHGGPTMGTDGTNYWITRQNALGPVVRFDFKPAATGSGSIVEYRSRLEINNGLDKLQTCL